MTQAPRGTHDIYGAEMRKWRRVEDAVRELTALYGYEEIRTPTFEATELFLRGVGEVTDIVQKEMYTFEDKSGRSLSLRPELTAGVARAYIERGMHNAPQPTRLYYIGACFRYEKPAAGRYRQHYQFGVECFGAGTAAAEAEIISLGYRLLEKLGIEGMRLHINSIGCAVCRAAYNEKLRTFLQAAELCALCASRLERNPMRVLDCKNPACAAQTKDAPATTASLCGECDTHFVILQELLTGMKIPFTVDAGVVRGLDYYTRTVFEFIKDGALTVIGGGRYDGLITQLGGAATPAAGFGMGMERLAALLPEETDAPAADIFIGSADAEGFAAACTLAAALRNAGIRAECELSARSVKAQMKYADKIKARFTTVLGSTELEAGECRVKNMQTGEVTAAALVDLDAVLRV